MEASAWARIDAGIGDQPAPVAGVMPALAQVADEIEIDGAAAAERHGRPLRLHARAVGGDQHVGGEVRLVRGHQLGQALGARLLAHLDDELGVEAEPAAALLAHRVERRHVEGVLALVVGGAAAVEPVAVAGGDPGALALGPLVLQAADDVAVAVAEHGRQLGVLDAGREQHRPLARQRVVVDARGEAQAREGRRHLLVEIAAQLGQAVGQQLALGAEGDAARELGLEGAVLDVFAGAGDGAGAGS